MKFGTIAAIVFVLAGTSFSTNPGFKARITKNGFDYASKIAVTSLAADIQKLSIPDISGSVSGVHYTLSGLHVSGFSPPVSTVTLSPSGGLQWKAAGAAANVAGNFKVKLAFIHSSGSVSVSASQVSFLLDIVLGADSSGRPKIADNGCSCSIGSVSVDFHGGIGKIINLFKGDAENAVKNTLPGKICDAVKNEVNGAAEAQLQKIPVNTTLDNVFLLDYRLLLAPKFATNYMETIHKGEIYWKSDVRQPPFSPPPIPDYDVTDRMLYLWLSDFIFDSAMYSAQMHGFLRYNLTQKDLPASSKGILNTTCTSFKCIGMLLPQIGQKYPNSQVELHMQSTMVPNTTISTSGVSVDCAGLIILYARQPNNVLAYLVTINATMHVKATVAVKNETVKGQVDDLQLNLVAVNSSVGPVSNETLQWVTNAALMVYLIPKLNEFGAKGFPLPITDGVQFLNTNVAFVQNNILISTDVNYTLAADVSSRTATPSSVLYFKPAVEAYGTGLHTYD